MKNILFVGAFNNNNKDGSTGGQLFACHSLINSDLKNHFNFIKIDSTITSVPIPPIWARAFKAIIRVVKFVYYLIFNKIDSVLIFSGDSFSFIEKGFMVIIAKAFSKNILFAPRSGMSLDDYTNSKFMKWYMKSVIRASTFVICQGQFWINFYKEMDFENDSKFILVSNWIDANFYNSINYKITETNLNILYIGWLEEYKGVLDLLEALIILKNKNKNFLCQIYGGGSLFDKIKIIISENELDNNVVLMGWANKQVKKEAYSKADIFILPSHFEGFPNSLIEAMSAELPVISSNVGAVGDIIEDGINGFIFDSKNINQLVEKIETLISDSDLRMIMAINARKKITKKFTVLQAVEKLNKIL